MAASAVDRDEATAVRVSNRGNAYPRLQSPLIFCSESMTLTAACWRTTTTFSSAFSIHRIRRFAMSTSAIVSQFPAPLRELVAAACPNEDAFGTTDNDQAEVDSWLQKVSGGKSLGPEVSYEIRYGIRTSC